MTCLRCLGSIMANLLLVILMPFLAALVLIDWARGKL